jgi:hypothetical protein
MEIAETNAMGNLNMILKQTANWPDLCILNEFELIQWPANYASPRWKHLTIWVPFSKWRDWIWFKFQQTISQMELPKFYKYIKDNFSLYEW